MGSLELKCVDCGATTSRSIEMTQHIAAEPYFVKEPNCTETGEKSATCSVCKAVFVEQVLQTNDVHDLQETVITPASCASAGEGEKTCTRCDYSEHCTYEPLEHTYGGWLYVFAATCTKEGMKQQICSQCGKERTETVPKTDHHWSANGPGSEICLFCFSGRSTGQATNPYLFVDNNNWPQMPEDIMPVMELWP